MVLFVVVCFSLFYLYIEHPAQADESSSANTPVLHSNEFHPKTFKNRNNPTLTNLGFNGVEFDPDTFIINDLFHKLEFKKVRENFSLGVTNRGLKFCIDW